MKTMEEIEKLKHGPAESGVVDLILQRWSPRSFSDRKVAPDDLKKLFLAAGWSASSYNEQPWRFFLGVRGEETYDKILAILVEFNQGWAKSAPVLILSIAKKTFSHSGLPNYYGLYDTGAATANLALQATALGMHTHSMAGLDRDKARVDFNVPDDYDIGAVTAVGYLGDVAGLPEAMRGMEESPRVRKPLDEFVFTAWERPAAF